MSERSNILGVGISITDLEETTQRIISATKNASHLGYVTVTGMHGVVESQSDPQLKRIHNRSFISTPDGMSLVWLNRFFGHAATSRVYGPDLMEKLFNDTQGSGLKHYIFGGAEGVAQKLKESLLKKYSQSVIVGTHTPPFRPLSSEEKRQLSEELQTLQPHLVWVGLSTPKQERFMHDFLESFPELNAGWGHGSTFIGVGAAFDFHSGRVSQAPLAIQNAGLEWLFRLATEPRRLWKRYLFGIPKFLFLLLLQTTGLKKFSLLK